ncbi:Vacuolar protein sorting-associated protein 33B [Cichlidogyrus casuarinus]|uniref:Vacuolar protein sorting-associated protein 33B n=1 Tax=Cichlidogyrus casuarinus TaxID=1844966 RepID=A0ABD2QDE5_9PLAT
MGALPPDQNHENLVYLISPTKSAIDTILKHVSADISFKITRQKLFIFVPLFIHYFGFTAEAVVAGIRASCSEKNSLADRRRNSVISLASTSSAHSEKQFEPPPLVIVFSRDLDYVTALLLPLTFEALINEVMNVDLGVVDLPADKISSGMAKKLQLNQINAKYYKLVRDQTMGHIVDILVAQRALLEDEKNNISLHLTSIKHSASSSSDVNHLSVVNSSLAPLLSCRRDLNALSICLEEIMETFTVRDRVEDWRTAQQSILESATGMPLQPGAKASEFKKSRTKTLGDDLNSSPMKLVYECIACNHGDNVGLALRLLCLISVTHDGLEQRLYDHVQTALLHAAGPSIMKVLIGLKHARLLQVRKASYDQEEESEEKSEESPNASRLDRLTKVASNLKTNPFLRRSNYNRVHQLLRLSSTEQIKASSEGAKAVNASYVFGGEHTPLVVKLTESVWAHSTHQGLANGNAFDGDLNVVPLTKLKEAMMCLPVKKASIETLGSVSLQSDPLEEPGMQKVITGKVPPCNMRNQAVLVVMAGGCTYAEVSALRSVAKRRHWDLLVATSHMIGSRDLVHLANKHALCPDFL